MRKSEADDSNDDVFYSMSSAVSDATLSASEVAGSPTLSIGTHDTMEAMSSSGSKSKGFGKLRSLRPKKLLSKKFKAGDTSSDTTPESSTVLLSKIDDGKESKIPKKSRASNLVRRLTFGKRHKVGPKTGSLDEESSIKKSETTGLSVSETSLCEIEEQSHEDSPIESERKASGASGSSGRQELKIKITGKKIEKIKKKYEEKTSTSAVGVKEKNNKKVDTKIAALVKNAIAPLPSPPPTPPMSSSIIHIPLKVDHVKPISVNDMTIERDPITTTTTTELLSIEKSSSVTYVSEPLKNQHQQNIQSLKNKFLDKLNINRSTHDRTPSVKAPAVPYNISDTEISHLLSSIENPKSQETFKSHEDSFESTKVSSLESTLSPDEYQEFIKKDREDSLIEATNEKIFTLVETKGDFMKRSEQKSSEILSTTTGTKKRSNSKKQESSESKSVHVQESQQPYQTQLSPSKLDETTKVNSPTEINFRIGTAVRPIKPSTPDTHINDSLSIDVGVQPLSKSQDEFSSLSSESPPISEASRRRIKYIPEPTLTLPEEQGLLNSNFGPPSSYISDYSIDYSLNPLSMSDTQEGQNSKEGGALNVQNMERREHLYKVLVIGELGTGKTSFIKRYVHQFFSQNYRATIGVDFALKVINWDPNTIIRLQLWDIAGQERFGNMTRVYYKEAVGAFIVFDVTRTATFDAVEKWKEDLDSKVQLPDGSKIPCILLANKCDQPKQGIATTPVKLDEYCEAHQFSAWYETSAKENINIDEAARALVTKILANDKVINANDVDNDGFALDQRNNGTSNNKKCAC